MNNFELISKLGEGSYSIVYKVRRKADLKMYALKKMKLKNLSEKEKQNALNEIRILASINSDHIITYKEAFIEEKEKILCLVTEFANKGDLFQKITYYKQMQKSFEEKDIWNIFIQILQGLKCLHDHKILHRDLKSANIFLFNNNLAKIGDFNVSKVSKTGIGYTQTGTPYYASPEVWNDEAYTNKSDIWSLGCVLYEMMYLTPPFKAENMEGLYHKIIKGKYKITDKYSKELNEILKLLLNVEQKERPSCDELLKNNIIKNKIEFFEGNKKFNDDINNNEDKELLKTIKISKNLLFLSGRLPKANYNNEKENEINNLKTIDNNKLLIKSITSINEEKKNYFRSNDGEMIIKCMQGISEKREDIKYIAIDTINSIMIADEMRRSKDKNFDKWVDLASCIFNLINIVPDLRDDLTVIFIGHTQTDDEGFTRLLTNGKKLNKIGLEKYFDTVLIAKNNDGKYVFETTSPNSTARVPMGSYENEQYIENDLYEVIKELKEF